MFGSRRWLGGRGRDLCPPFDGRLRCLHPWPEHVRSGARGMAGRQMERLVGNNPPYHAPTFVLTHHAREPIVMEGGTTLDFVTDGIHAALERARDAAETRDVKIGGGVSTVRQYLQAGLIDELHFAFSPVLLGRGQAMFEGLDLPGPRLLRDAIHRHGAPQRTSCSGARRTNKRPGPLGPSPDRGRAANPPIPAKADRGCRRRFPEAE